MRSGHAIIRRHVVINNCRDRLLRAGNIQTDGDGYKLIAPIQTMNQPEGAVGGKRGGGRGKKEAPPAATRRNPGKPAAIRTNPKATRSHRLSHRLSHRRSRRRSRRRSHRNPAGFSPGFSDQTANRWRLTPIARR